MNRILYRLTYFFILIFAVSFIIFLITSAYFVRPCSDDLWFYYEYIHKGWFNAINEFNYNKRWVSYLTYNSICLLTKNFENLHKAFFIYYIFIFSFLLFSTTRLISISASSFLKLNLNTYHSLLLAVMFIAALYISTLHGQEVWFWTVANAAYLLPIPLLFIGISEFINNNSLLSKVILSLTFFLIGGTLENLIIGVFSILFLYLFYTIKINNKDQIIKTILAISSIIILPILSLLGNGISNRMNLDKKSLKNQTINYFETVFFDYELKLNMPRITIFICTVFIIFLIANNLKLAHKLNTVNFKKIFKVNVILMVIVFIATYLPLVKIFGNLGSARASIPFTLFICSSICFWLFIIGLHKKINPILFNAIFVIFGAASMLIFTIKQYSSSKKYAFAYDKRVKYILTQKNSSSKFILVNPLPDPGVLACQEVGKNHDKVSITSYYLGRVNGINKDILLK